MRAAHSARERPERQPPCARSCFFFAAGKDPVLRLISWQVGLLGVRVGEASHPGPSTAPRRTTAPLIQEAREGEVASEPEFVAEEIEMDPCPTGVAAHGVAVASPLPGAPAQSAVGVRARVADEPCPALVDSDSDDGPDLA